MKNPKRYEGGDGRSYATPGRRGLSREEEHALALRAQRGDVEARNRLIHHGLPLVVAFVRRLSLGTVRVDDVVQEGCLGLLRALETFDPRAGTRLSTYAVWWIRSFVGRYLCEARSIVRPRGGVLALADFSLDAPVSDDDDSTHLDRVEEDGPDPEDALLSSEAVRGVREALTLLQERIGAVGWDVVHSRLQSDDPDTLEVVAARWGLSRERVRQIELRTKRLLAGLLEPESQEAA
jgi:RNA polymerase primary sigma factor